MLRVVVAVKQVAALDDDFELEPGAVEVEPDFVERELNEWDAFSSRRRCRSRRPRARRRRWSS